MWGDDTEVWDPDPDVDAEGNPVRKMTAGGFELSRLEQLYNCMDAVIADGRELMQIYIDSCRRHGIAAIASMRMNDAHTSDEAREWQVRSRRKKSRPDLLIGSPTPTRAGGADRWNFCWQWDYEQEEVRDRFLGLVDETLERYDFDGVELDWMRGPPYFRPGGLLDKPRHPHRLHARGPFHRARPRRKQGEAGLPARPRPPLPGRGPRHRHRRHGLDPRAGRRPLRALLLVVLSRRGSTSPRRSRAPRRAGRRSTSGSTAPPA